MDYLRKRLQNRNHNPNPNLRSRELIGLQLIEGFTYIGKNVWEKESINPKLV